jgi:hypothetical protein
VSNLISASCWGEKNSTKKKTQQNFITLFWVSLSVVCTEKSLLFLLLLIPCGYFDIWKISVLIIRALITCHTFIVFKSTHCWLPFDVVGGRVSFCTSKFMIFRICNFRIPSHMFFVETPSLQRARNTTEPSFASTQHTLHTHTHQPIVFTQYTIK